MGHKHPVYTEEEIEDAYSDNPEKLQARRVKLLRDMSLELVRSAKEKGVYRKIKNHDDTSS